MVRSQARAYADELLFEYKREISCGEDGCAGAFPLDLKVKVVVRSAAELKLVVQTSVSGGDISSSMRFVARHDVVRHFELFVICDCYAHARVRLICRFKFERVCVRSELGCDRTSCFFQREIRGDAHFRRVWFFNDGVSRVCEVEWFHTPWRIIGSNIPRYRLPAALSSKALMLLYPQKTAVSLLQIT